MIMDLRYHLASLVAVFFALGLGILIGTSLGNDGGLLEEQERLIESIESQLTVLRKDNVDLSHKLEQLQARVQLGDALGERALQRLVAGSLQDRRVALLVDGMQETEEIGDLVVKLQSVLDAAGANVLVTGWLKLPTEQESRANTAVVATEVVKALIEWKKTVSAEILSRGLRSFSRSGDASVDTVVLVTSRLSELGSRLQREVVQNGAMLAVAVPGTVDEWNRTNRVKRPGDTLFVANASVATGQLALVWGLASGAKGWLGTLDQAGQVFPSPPHSEPEEPAL